MNKRGLSHIEVILGFVIFMIAIFFLLASYQPLFKSDYNEKQIVQKLYSSFLKNTTTEVRDYYLFAIGNAKDNLTINLDENLLGYGLVAIDETENKYEVTNVDLNSGVLCLNNLRGGKQFIIIRAIKGLSLSYSSSACQTDENRYNISTSNKEEIVIIDKLVKFNSSYYDNFAGLKSSLEINSNNNFYYNISLEKREYFGNINAEYARANVYSSIRKLSIINETGLKEGAEAVFKIW